MEMTIASIISSVTLLIGYISKRFNLVNSKFIPTQNIVIGLVSGLLVYLTGLEYNIYNAIVTCLISSMSAGGIYDTLHTRKEELNENQS